jgi:predicted N-formylglutamate amidohydrolase
MLHDAFEVVGRPGPVLYTCEHASNRLPRPWRARRGDRPLLAAHWGYDIGAARVTRVLARRTPGLAVLARWTRLLLDPNRDPADPTAVLTHTDDGDPSFNRTVDLPGRVARFHGPFHTAIAEAIALSRPRWIWSIHSFTPSFRSVARPMEAGVLFDQHDETCARLADALNAEGLRTELNEPYSGKAGLIYSASRHGRGQGVPYLEIELRQDLIASRAGASRVADIVLRAQRRVGF